MKWITTKTRIDLLQTAYYVIVIPKSFIQKTVFAYQKNKDKNNTTDTQFIVYKVGDDSFQIVLQKKKPWNDVDVNCKETWHIKLFLY